MTRQELDNFILELDKESFEEYYRHHNNKDVCSFYAIKKTDINKILERLGISKKTKDEINSIISNTFNNKSEEEIQAYIRKREVTMSNWSDDKKAQLSEIRKRAWTDEAKEKQRASFKLSRESKTPEDLAIEHTNRSAAAKNFWNNATEEYRDSFRELMSNTYASLPEEVKQKRSEKISQTRKDKGLENPMLSATAKQKLVETNLAKYGVPYYCMTKKCRSALGGNSSLSNPNNSFKELLESIGFTCSDEERGNSFSTEYNLERFSYDFKVGNTLIEINPAATHNSTWSPFGEGKGVAKDYHSRKTETAVANGYRCIHVWDWDDVNKITSLLQDRETIYARNCKVSEVDTVTAKDFIERYHLQGFAKSRINLGLYYKDEIVSIMTFDKPRYNKNYEYELVRYCSSCNIIGGAKKLFKHFINEYSPSSVISYCDLSKFTGDTYDKLGFTFKSKTISKHWFNIKTGRHITDNLLRQQGFDRLFNTNFGKGTSNRELMLENGFVEIYDAGQATYIWN